MKRLLTKLYVLFTCSWVATHSFAQSVQTYTYTGSVQTYTVPACVSQVTLDVRGAQGGQANDKVVANGPGGLGGRAFGVLTVTPGQVLYIHVGGQGNPNGSGGYNGGGAGGTSTAGASCSGGPAGGGGGASDIRLGGNTLSNRIIVAGGGGGAGRDYCNGTCQPCGCSGNGGCGGGLIGNPGLPAVCTEGQNTWSGAMMNFGAAGTQTASGAGGPADPTGSSTILGNPGTSGTLAVGGSGGNGTYDVAGGGGGGGYFGGGGGGGARSGSGVGGGGGGGGSSYLSALTNTFTSACFQTSNGIVIIYEEQQPVTLVASASPTIICTGNTATLSVSGASSFTWSTGAQLPTITVTPTSSAIYTVVGTTTNNCPAVGTVAVLVDDGLPALVISSASACAGQSAALHASGANSYAWTGGILNGVPFIPTSTSVYTVAGSNACGVSTSTALVTVAPAPTLTPIVSSSTVCSGNDITLNASGASNYYWTSGVINGVAFTPSASASYTVTGAGANGCTGSAVASITVVPFTGGSISVTPASTAVCLGGSVNLSAAGVSSYSWQNGQTTPAISVSPSGNGVYNVTGTNVAGCVSYAQASVQVFTTSAINVVASSLSVCAGKTLAITATGASTYSFTGGVTNGQPFVPATSNTYLVAGINACGTSTASINIVVHSVPTLAISASSPTVCSGYSVTLTGSGATSYTWSGGINNGLPFAPLVTDSYTLSGENAQGCSAQAVATIAVYNSPTVSPVVSPLQICPGESATVSASGASTYTWHPGLSNSPQITVTATASTVYTVIQANQYCSETKTVLVSVQPVTPFSVTAQPATLCAGLSATLIANGANSYSWSSGQTGVSTVVLSPSASAVYTVYGLSGICPVPPVTVSVQVNPNPTLTPAVPIVSICAGQTATLSVSGALTYSWDPGVTAAGATALVTPSTLTLYNVSGQNQFGCLSHTSIVVAVQPVPNLQVFASPAFICNGNSATLVAMGGNTYSWSTGIAGSSVVVAPAAITVYTVQAFLVPGCPAVATITVEVLTSSLTVNGTSSICAGQQATLIASGSTSYSWSTAQTTQSITVSPLINTTYKVTGTTVSGNLTCKSTDTLTLYVFPKPVLGATASRTQICRGEQVVLTALGATNYSWIPASSGSTLADFPLQTIIYTVTGSNSHGCTASATLEVKVNPCAAIDESLLSGIGWAVYPNPSQGEIHVSASRTVKLGLVSALGQLLQPIEAAPGEPVIITGLARGVYFILESGTRPKALKVIVD